MPSGLLYEFYAMKKLMEEKGPSLDRLLKYAHALGYDLIFKLIPLKKLKHAE